MVEQVILKRYKITRQLDEGGMSLIYLARQLVMNRDVVVKVLKPEYQKQSKPREHFRREIHIMSGFKHPNAVEYLDAAPHDPAGPVLVMEYLRGIDLGILRHRQGRFTPERAGRLLGQLCDVLQAVHDAGIIHRDLKPGNVMIVNPGTSEETIKLMDFGLAKMTSMLYIAPDELQNYPEPAASGTPEYICPEEVRGTAVDPRSDIYSVGVLLYELLAGRRPFESSNPHHLMRFHEEGTPPTFAEIGLGEEIPSAIEEVVRCCLNKQPDQRPRNATDLALRYEQALGKRITQFRRSGPPPASSRVPTLRNSSAPAGQPATNRAVPATRSPMQHSIEAVMPEALALVKLKGFIHDLGGAVVESVPGLIRVQLGDPNEKKKSGLLDWFNGGAHTATTVLAMEIELHMERRDPNQPNRLTVTLVVNPGRGPLTPELRAQSNKLGRDLQAYLMGR